MLFYSPTIVGTVMTLGRIIISLFLYDLSYCYGSVEDFSYHLGTKSPYRFVANYKTSAYKCPVDCTPMKIWMMVRHGTRYPGKKDIKFINEELPQLKSHILQNHRNENGMLDAKQLEDFKDWSLRVPPDEEKNLQYEGEDEMKDLAERMQIRFPSLFPETYSNSTYQFRYTATQRTQQSAVNFAIGLFGRKNAKEVWFPAAGSSDIVLRSYKICPKWISQVKRNPEVLFERKTFGESVLMAKSLKEVSDKLGFETPLPLNTIHKMYKTCAFETAWLKKINSPWCHAFNLGNIKVLEYYDDLKYYWVDGYGKQLTTLVSCPAVKDFIDHLTSDTGHVVSVSFSHSGTLLKLLTHLSLYQPQEHLTHKVIDHQRPWKVSKIDPFASNIALVRYKCNYTEDFILALHQERTVLLPGCTDTLCPVKTVTKHLYDSLYKCDFDGMCKEERRRTGKFVAILVGISLICLAMYHAWVRRLPVIASLIVPALIMLLYVLWVLYTASRDKRAKCLVEAEVDPNEVVCNDPTAIPPSNSPPSSEVTPAKDPALRIKLSSLPKLSTTGCHSHVPGVDNNYRWKRSFSIA